MKLDPLCSGCFAGLSCGSRMEIVNLLQAKGRMSVLSIAKHFRISQPTITYHLQYLRKVGLLSSRKEGTKIYYFVKDNCRGGKCRVLS
ncbi:MAG: metalloregulator ArsR/SmtB family transcription factor [Patescibacteria group bacterium]